jgi:protein TonB
MSDTESVHAPLSAPTYLTHVTAPVFRRGRALGFAAAVHLVVFTLVVLVLSHRFRVLAPDEATVSLVIEPSPYVGTGPTVKTPAAKAQPRTIQTQAPPRAVQSARTPANAAQTSPEVVHAAPAAAVLPLPAPPAPLAPRPSLAEPLQAAAPSPHEGDDQRPGSGLILDSRIRPARPDDRDNRPPHYPPLALAHREQGNVLLSIQVAPSGRASAVTIVASSGFSILDEAAREAVLGWRFLPADFHGKPVSSTLLLPVNFQIDATADR